MKNRYLVIHGFARDRYEAITMCGEALYKEGLVSEQFGTLCVEREKNYPTGLPRRFLQPSRMPKMRASHKTVFVSSNWTGLFLLSGWMTIPRMSVQI